MKKIINRIFSDKYVNHNAVVGNILLLLMYRFAYPFAVLLNKLRLSPNQITTQSLIFSILAFFSLVYDDSYLWFSIFWGLTILMDFCDGTVARMANKVSKTAFRYDHMSDLFKIFLIIFGVGLRYHDYIVWMVIFVTLFLFLYSDILNIQLNYSLKKQENIIKDVSINQGQLAVRVRWRDRSRLVAFVVKSDVFFKVAVNLRSVLLTINGHTLLLFLLVPYGREYAMYLCFYLMSLNILSILSRISHLIKLPKVA